MQINKWRKSHKQKETTGIEEQTAILTSEQETEVTEASEIVCSEIESTSRYIVAKRPATTWVWDRKRQTWLEIIAKPTKIASLGDIGGTKKNHMVELPQLSALTAPAHRIKYLKSIWRLFPDRRHVTRVIDALTFKGKVFKTLPSEADAHKASGMELVPAVAYIDSKGEADELNKVLIQDAEIQAKEIIALAEDRARAWADRIVAQAEQRAAERIEGIIVKAEESALAKAINIIIMAEERAEALAGHIIARAEELAQSRAENIIAQAEEKGQKQSKNNIISEVEQAKVQNEKTIVNTKEMQQQVIAATKHEAERMIKVSDDELKELKVDVVKEIKALPRQTGLLAQEGEQDELAIPCKGTAELLIESPVDYGIVRTVLKRIRMFGDIKILDLGGTADEGVRIRLLSQDLERLPFKIRDIPEIEQIAFLPMKTSRMYPLQRILPGIRKRNGHPDRRILLKIG